MVHSTKHALLHLSLINGIGPAAIRVLLDSVGQADFIEYLYTSSAKALINRCGFSESLAQSITDGLRDQALLQRELDMIDKHGFLWCSIQCPEYPELLKHIHSPPSILYWQGALESLNNPTLAVVGSRKANFYGKDAITLIVPPLINAGWTIVSGGALGADSMAHNAALASGGKTVAVLGSGLLHQYPTSNKKMFAEIVNQGGAIISSFAVDTPAYPTNFPIRNRIVSGLSKGCFVVQAAEKSGARITAQYALDQGRDVFAFPGSIKDSLSKGCHDLIQLGAKLVTCAHDILSEYQTIYQTDRSYVQHSLLDTKEQAAYDTPAAKIIAACAQPQSVESLLMHTDCSLSELQTLLFELQLDGKIKQDFTGMWSV